MTIIRRLKKGAGLIAALWLMGAARVFKSAPLYRSVLAADPNYLAALPYAVAGSVDSPSHSQIMQFVIAARLAGVTPASQVPGLKKLLGISEAQILQDVFCAVALKQKRNGYFVEVGVGEGRSISNTYMLEKHFNWDGILVEPNRSSHERIRGCRSAFLETRAAASRTGNRLRFQEVVGAGEYSRIADTGGLDLTHFKIDEYDVDTVTLNDVFASRGAPQEIDYLSLDTEGSEIDILKGLDFDHYTFNVLTIEHNYNARTLSMLDAILLPRGYRRILSDISSVDAWYLNERIASSAYHSLS